MTLAIPISSDAERRLEDKAKAAGLDLPTFVSHLLEAEARRPTLVELSGEVFENFKRMKMSDEELAQQLEEEKHADRSARRDAAFTE